MVVNYEAIVANAVSYYARNYDGAVPYYFVMSFIIQATGHHRKL